MANKCILLIFLEFKKCEWKKDFQDLQENQENHKQIKNHAYMQTILKAYLKIFFWVYIDFIQKFLVVVISVLELKKATNKFPI